MENYLKNSPSYLLRNRCCGVIRKMRVISLSTAGVKAIRPSIVQMAKDGSKPSYCFLHGEQGRGRWEVRFPLGFKSFPFQGEEAKPSEEQEYQLVKLEGKKDPRGNQLVLLGVGRQDGEFLVLWHLSPGFRGSATFEIEGKAELIAEGYEAQGDAGRVGGASCPVVRVFGQATLSWGRSGRLYGSPSRWVARFDGQVWQVAEATSDAVQASLEEV